jgi:hypothetical protein
MQSDHGGESHNRVGIRASIVEGLRVEAMLDANSYLRGIEVTDEEFDAIDLHRRRFHGDWNY